MSVTEMITAVAKWDETLKFRVTRGAAYLDSREPGWAVRIDPEELNMGSCYRCVIGQAFGFYLDAIDDVAPDEVNGDWQYINAWSKQHGFTADDFLSVSRGEQYEWLREAWLTEIDGRLSSGKESA